MKCCICGKEIKGYGNSPFPIAGNKCCDECNTNIVLPARIFINEIKNEKWALWITKNKVQFVKPSGSVFTLKELQKLVGGYIEVISSKIPNYIDVVDEEGLLKKKEFNRLAYLLFDVEYYGDVLICPLKIFE